MDAQFSGLFPADQAPYIEWIPCPRFQNLPYNLILLLVSESSGIKLLWERLEESLFFLFLEANFFITERFEYH